MTASGTSTTANMKVQPPNTHSPGSPVPSEALLEAETGTAKATAVKIFRKRSLPDNPMLYFMKYYAKYKVWQNDNSDLGSIKKSNDYHTTKYLGNDAFIINNDLFENGKKKVKRSIKKFEHLRLPEDPFQDRSNFVKHEPGVKYVKGDPKVVNVKSFLEKISKGDSRVAKNSLNLQKSEKNVQKLPVDFTTVLPLNYVENTKIQTISIIGKMWPDKSFRQLHKKVLPEKN